MSSNDSNEILLECIGLYDSAVKSVVMQKPFSTIDYDRITIDINNINERLDVLKEKYVGQKFSQVVDSLQHTTWSLSVLTEGLSKKASRSGGYGFLQYRKDRKDFETLHQQYLLSLKLLQNE